MCVLFDSYRFVTKDACPHSRHNRRAQNPGEFVVTFPGGSRKIPARPHVLTEAQPTTVVSVQGGMSERPQILQRPLGGILELVRESLGRRMGVY